MNLLFYFNHFLFINHLFYSAILFNSDDGDEIARSGWWRRRSGRQRDNKADGDSKDEAGDEGADYNTIINYRVLGSNCS